MALLPFVFYDWEDLVSSCLLDQTLGLDFRHPKCLSLPAETVCLKSPQQNHPLSELRDLLNLSTRRSESSRAPIVHKDDFHAVLDVQHFRPEEIEVKVVDNFLIITAKHEDKRDDHGWVSRQFVRRYQLPENINLDQLTSHLSSDGLLTIIAPKIQHLKDEKERTLKIKCTGKPFVTKKQEKPQTLEQTEEKKPE